MIEKEINLNDKRELWMRLINARDEEELNMLNQTRALMIQKAVLKLKQMSEDDRLKESARMREKTIHDEISALNTARREGREEGKMEIISQLRQMGIPEETIRQLSKS